MVRVHKRLIEERANPSYPPFVDTVEHMKKQWHLTEEDFESPMQVPFPLSQQSLPL